MARKKQITSVNAISDSERAELIAEQSVRLAEYAAKIVIAAEQLRIKTKPVEGLSLDEHEQAFLAALPAITAKIKKKLSKLGAELTVAEVTSMVMSVAEEFPEAEPKQQVALLLVVKKLMDCLQNNVVMPEEPVKGRTPKPVGVVYQFKITLLESHPPIWRRIQIEDCTLDKLHEHIQTAMGWTNSHLHHFKLDEEYYGDRMLMGDNFREFGYHDSTTTKLSDILPKTRKKFRLVYEYDFGDSWNHEVLFEGVVPPDAKAKYPICLEGARACPPDDCGGVWGYSDFLAAIGNKKNKRHREMLEWIGGSFDPEEFDSAAKTKEMKKGLPDWRRMA